VPRGRVTTDSEEAGRCASRPCDDGSVCRQVGAGASLPCQTYQHSAWRHASGELGWLSSCGDCPVCRFLAQKPLPALEVEEISFTPFDQDLAPATPVRCAGDLPASYRVRAPPTVV